MNDDHVAFCGSDAWREMVVGNILPWALDGADLGARVLEVGPGLGVTTDELSARCEELTAVELDAGLAAALRERFAGTNVRVITGDAADLDLPSGSFTGAASFSMLHHVPTEAMQDRVFAGLARVLEPGGVLVALDSLADPGLEAFHAGDTYNPIDPAGLQARLEAAGFTDIAIKSNDYGWGAVARRNPAPA